MVRKVYFYRLRQIVYTNIIKHTVDIDDAFGDCKFEAKGENNGRKWKCSLASKRIRVREVENLKVWISGNRKASKTVHVCHRIHGWFSVLYMSFQFARSLILQMFSLGFRTQRFILPWHTYWFYCSALVLSTFRNNPKCFLFVIQTSLVFCVVPLTWNKCTYLGPFGWDGSTFLRKHFAATRITLQELK